MNYLGLNTYEKPFSDVKVRQAVNHAVNRPLINKAMFNDKAILCAGPISRAPSGPTPVEALCLRSGQGQAAAGRSGYPNGFEMRLAFGTYMPRSRSRRGHRRRPGQGRHQGHPRAFERAVQWDRYKNKLHQTFIYFWMMRPNPTATCIPCSTPRAATITTRANRSMRCWRRGGPPWIGRPAKVYNEIDRFLYHDAPWIYLYVIPEVFGVANSVDYKGCGTGI